VILCAGLNNRGDKVIVKKNKKIEGVRDVVATMAIEDMYLSKDFVVELIKVAEGEKTSEQLRQEVISRYAG
jgi:hypothetical protein